MAIIPGSAKVLNQYENVNTTYGGSKAMKAQSKWYTMQDVEDTINANKPYKVFTALLTQSGGSSNQSLAEGSVTKGITYLIVGENGNYSNVGAPNSENGTYFIATNNEVPITFGDSSLDYNTGTPVATVLENTIGNVWFVFDANGNYLLVSDNLFVNNKTAKFGGWTNLDLGIYFLVGDGNDSSEAIYLSTGDPARANNILQQATIEIRVYN